MIALLDVFADAGIEARDVRVPGRPYQHEPEGLMGHWTGAGARYSSPVPSLRTVTHGRPDVPGPLYHALLGRDGVWRVVTDGYANHAGRGNASTLDAMAAGNAPLERARDRGLADEGSGGNRRTIGVSVENAGEAMPPHVEHAWIDGVAAILAAHGWGAGHFIAHSAYTARKIDFPTATNVRHHAMIAAAVRLAAELPVGPEGLTTPLIVPGFRIEERIIGYAPAPAGGSWLLGEDDGIYAVAGAPYYGSLREDPKRQPHIYTPIGRSSRIRAHDGGYVITTDRGYAYHFDQSSAP